MSDEAYIERDGWMRKAKSLESQNQALQEECQRLLEQGELWQQALADEIRNSVALQERIEELEGDQAQLLAFLRETSDTMKTGAPGYQMARIVDNVLQKFDALSPTQETNPE